jgi:hypothetical protein
MCEEGYGGESKGFVKPEIVERGRDFSEFRSIVRTTFPYWRNAVCGQCAGTASTVRCRRHFLEQETSLASELEAQKGFVANIFHHITKYSCSFRWGFQHTRTAEDAAALIMAVGWCSGWRLLLSIMEAPSSDF